mgnify:CR=1 FL=1
MDNSKKLTLRCIKKYLTIDNGEIVKAKINSSGYEVFTDGKLFVVPFTNFLVPLEEGSVTLEEVESFFNDFDERKTIVKSNYEKDRETLNFRLSLLTLKNVVERSYAKGDFSLRDWDLYCYNAIYLDKDLFRLYLLDGCDENDPFFKKESTLVFSFLCDLKNLDKSDILAVSDFIIDLNNAYKELGCNPSFKQYSYNQLAHICSYFEINKNKLENNKEALYLYDKCLGILNDKYHSVRALKTLAYSHYFGTPYEAANYKKAEDDLLMLYGNGDPQAAYFLGCLYLEHNPNGSSDLEQAYPFLSVASSFGIMEAKLKAGDILSNKDFSNYSIDLSDEMYNHVYYYMLKDFVDGKYALPFADSAYRISLTFRNADFGHIDLEMETGFLLFARYAIKKKLLIANNQDNVSLSYLIDSRYKEIKIDVDTNNELTSENDFYFGFTQFFKQSNLVMVKNIKRDGNYISFDLESFYGNKTLLSFLKVKKACFLKSIRYKIETDKSTYFPSRSFTFSNADVHIEKDNNYIVFTGLSIKSRSNIYLPFVSFFPILNEDNGELVTLISVSSDLDLINPLVKTFDCLCIDEEIKPGDLVLLPNKNKAKVISILKCKEDDLVLPKELYEVAKKI